MKRLLKVLVFFSFVLPLPTTDVVIDQSAVATSIVVIDQNAVAIISVVVLFVYVYVGPLPPEQEHVEQSVVTTTIVVAIEQSTVAPNQREIIQIQMSKSPFTKQALRVVASPNHPKIEKNKVK